MENINNCKEIIKGLKCKLQITEGNKAFDELLTT